MCGKGQCSTDFGEPIDSEKSFRDQGNNSMHLNCQFSFSRSHSYACSPKTLKAQDFGSESKIEGY